MYKVLKTCPSATETELIDTLLNKHLKPNLPNYISCIVV